MSRPTISKASTSYPIYAATWSSGKPGHLAVGGGGGSGRHGVKNSISLFDFSSRAPTIEPAVELEVSKDDSVTCLANLATKDGLILYAGNGGSVEERLEGRDMHFKSFEVEFPKGKTASLSEGKPGAIRLSSKCQLFSVPKSESSRKEVYQRLLKLSPPQRTPSSIPTKRIGAIATGLGGEENEIVIFSATSNRPDAQDIIRRIPLKGQEANDLDIQDQEEGRHQLAYALDYDVYVVDCNYDFAQRKNRTEKERRKVHTIPQPDIGEKRLRSKIRGVRWISPKHLLLLSNKPNRTGSELLVLHLYEEGPGSIVVRKSLPRHVTAATDFDVSLLEADASGAYQIVVAVGGADISLSVFTLEYHSDTVGHFHKYATYDNVHDVQMTKVVFSPQFQSATTAGKPQYLRLASTSLGNTINVDTFELQREGARLVLQTARTRRLLSLATYSVIAVVIAAVALMIQSLIDPSGSLTKGLVPASLQGMAGNTFGEVHRAKREAALNDINTPAVKVERRIRDLLHLHNPPLGSSSPKTEKALIIHHDPETDGQLQTEVHDGHEAVLKKHTEAKKWDDLSKEDQRLWKKKLTDTGMWAAGEGETILKSIFFGQIGGLVGQVAQGVLG
ncbi:hypothetical protein CC86DRAFT_319474 [Ophiobolus disseminans]|uniref:Guanine nucleotide-exchange factor SEC12 n=1 Tax=Ophiobolus disseminans TaxID=1469910 RepID=A0A6A7A753_9PLEO|nr:hypothetical protein CC86DRAFT_319474 [Ophiobolus disseminans]